MGSVPSAGVDDRRIKRQQHRLMRWLETFKECFGLHRLRLPYAVGISPAARAIVQEIFTAYLFAQRPHYLRRIEALKSVQLRI